MKDWGLIVMCTTCGVGPSWKRHSVGMGVSRVLELVGGGLYIRGGWEMEGLG